MRTFALILVIGCLCMSGGMARAETAEEQLAAASALFDAHKFGEAAAKLDTFLAANPKHARAGAAAFALGRCRTELHQYPLAIAAYEKAIATKDSTVQTLAELGLGEAATNARQFDKAAAALDAAVREKLRPEQAPYAWLWLGQADFQLKRYGPAEEAYNHVIHDYSQSDAAESAFFGAGMAALRQNKGDQARDRFRTLADRFPRGVDRPQALLLTAQIDFDAKRYGEARGEFERALNDGTAKATPEIQSAAEDGLIQTLLALKDYNAAAARLEAAVNRLPATDPQRYQAALSLGACRYRQQQYEPALAAYQTAAKAQDAEVAAQGLYWAGNSALALHRPLDAAGFLSKVATNYPKAEIAPRAEMKAGDAYAEAKQTDAAMQAYRAVLERYPQSPEAAEAHKALGSVVEGVTDPVKLAAALKNTPPSERPRATLRLARLYLDGGKNAEAASTLIDLLKARPDDDTTAEGRYLLGLAYEAQQKGATAVTSLALAVQIRPNAGWAADAQERLAWLYLEQKQPGSAEKAADAALALKPDSALEQQARLALVQALLDQQKWDAALEACKPILAANPPPDTLATVVYTQAWATGKKSSAEDALPLWERIANDFPKSPYAAEALVHVGDARLKAEKYAEAADRYSKALSDFPQSPFAVEARFKRGSALYNMDRPTDAATDFDAVANARPAGEYTAEALYWSGVAMQKADRKADAIQRLEKLIAAYPKSPRVANAKIRLAALKAVAGS